jgi:L,D-peptidoglycan transpeptidase YkuD (ErfK/YbiS/YcfS/YnhG family)
MDAQVMKYPVCERKDMRACLGRGVSVPAYDYAAVIAYNTARVPGRGSAIFLHVGTGTATAGRVSLPRPELIKGAALAEPRRAPGDHDLRALISAR